MSQNKDWLLYTILSLLQTNNIPSDSGQYFRSCRCERNRVAVVPADAGRRPLSVREVLADDGMSS